jgi:ubiquinone/menaquinone biosynthesis C-methylase UbiE
MNTPFDLEKITRKIIENLYKGNSKRLLNKTHKQLTKFGNRLVSVGALEQSTILEIGSGNGELLPHVNGSFKKYYMTDISSWGKSEIELISKLDERVIFEIQNVENLSYPDDCFDRVILTCVVAHLTEPFEALQELRRVTKPKGIISIFVSTDPSILLRVIRKVMINKKMKNIDIPYRLYNAIEHRNTPISIIEMVKWIYKKDSIKTDYYPFNLKSWNLSTHIVINIIKN